jgi:hypothetical protein
MVARGIKNVPYETFSLDFELFANNSSRGARLKNKSSYHAAITSKIQVNTIHLFLADISFFSKLGRFLFLLEKINL